MFKVFPTTGLRALVQNLKNTFIVACGMFFAFSFFDPDIGFLDAQAELTILTFIIPIFYTLIFLATKMASNISTNLIFYGVPVAVFSALMLCKMSALGGPGTLLLVTLHIYQKFMLFYGHPEPFEEPFEESNIPEYGSDKLLKASSSFNDDDDIRNNRQSVRFEEDTTTTEEPHDNTTSGELISESSPERKNYQNVCRSRKAASTASILSISDALSSPSPIPRSAYSEPHNISSIRKSINMSARSLIHNLAEVLPSSLEGANSVCLQGAS